MFLQVLLQFKAFQTTLIFLLGLFSLFTAHTQCTRLNAVSSIPLGICLHFVHLLISMSSAMTCHMLQGIIPMPKTTVSGPSSLYPPLYGRAVLCWYTALRNCIYFSEIASLWWTLDGINMPFSFHFFVISEKSFPGGAQEYALTPWYCLTDLLSYRPIVISWLNWNRYNLKLYMPLDSESLILLPKSVLPLRTWLWSQKARPCSPSLSFFWELLN